MKKITFLTFFAFFSIQIGFAQNVSYKERNPEFEFFDFSNDTIVIPLKTPIVNNKNAFVSKLPYPILFIHGLNSSSETWNSTSNYLDAQYGFTFGGRFDYCLNSDNSDSNANTNFYPIANADITAFDGTSIQNGDYFYVNFNVDPDGSFGTSVYSNQSAIVKQGVAVKNAVGRILTITGKDKVILVGHSMGGLASREYIQNQTNWQSDNKHHIAKLLTLGTPHGGSNASDIGLGWIIGMETHSEALRDLKTTYYYSGDQGRYLFGGLEYNDSNNMNEHLFGDDYWNIDINCNGVIGDNIIGLNQKSIDQLIDFTNVIGRVNGDSTDGVVTEASAKMNNYLTNLQFPAKYFYYTAIGVEVHTALTSQVFEIFQGLDEPQVKELAYDIETNKDYIGYTTIQENSSNPDIDIYKFNISDYMITNIAINNIVTSQMTAEILDAAGNTITPVQNNSGGSLTLNTTLATGDYFLKITSTSPSSSDYETPYAFSLTTTLDTNNFEQQDFVVYPNPFTNIINFDKVEFEKGYIYSILGEKVLEFDNSTERLDTSELSSGLYLLTLTSSNSTKTIKMIKQ